MSPSPPRWPCSLVSPGPVQVWVLGSFPSALLLFGSTVCQAGGVGTVGFSYQGTVTLGVEALYEFQKMPDGSDPSGLPCYGAN